MIYLLLSLGICGLDLWIKGRVEACEEKDLPKEILGGRILVRKSHNRGGVLNILEGRQKLVRGVSVFLMLVLAVNNLRLLGRRGLRLLKAGSAFLVGGAASNVWDRLTRKYVVDYFSFKVKWKKLRSVVFNLGDIFIFLGSFLVILWNLRRKS